MRKRLPPLNSLTAFEAVSELGSFSRAGEALSLTHSAVSHQVKQLEEHLGTRLFERMPRKVILTTEGSVYLREVKAALNQLEGAETVLRQHSASRPLRISVLPSFAGNLLIPELLPFLLRHPHIRVEIDATAGIENEENADIDVFIRYGTGDWPAFESIRLLAVQLFPVCSRAYLERHGPFAEPADLARAVLLRHTREPWEPWLDVAFSDSGRAPPVIPAGPLFSDARLMLDAACDGHGVALARSVLAAGDLRDGKLVRLCDVGVESPQSYHAYLRPSARARPSTQAFIEWLLATCSRFDQEAGPTALPESRSVSMLSASFALTTPQILYLGVAALLGGIVFGVTGFAFGIVASVLLHQAFAPRDVIFILVAGGFVLNLSSLPRFFREVQLARALPFMLGATLGMPLGLALLALLEPRALRIGVGVLIVAYCAFALHRHRRAAIRLQGPLARAVDVGIGFAGGISGGVAGLGPLIPGVWYGLQGLGKAEQRALAQPFGLYVQGFMMLALIVSGSAGMTAIGCVLAMTPVLLLGSFVGMRVFDRVGLVGFQRLVLGGCLVGGLLLIARQLHWLDS